MLGADLGHALLVLGTPGDTALWKHRPGLDIWEPIFVDGNAPSDVVCGRHREAFVITDDGTRLIRIDGDTYGTEADVTLPGQAQALTYDDASDEVILLSLTEHAIFRYDDGLQEPPVIQFPDDLPFGDDARVACDPTDGAVWCIVDGDRTVYRVEDGITQAVALPGLSAPEAIDFSDSGRVFVSDQGAVMEFVRDEGGDYDYPPDRIFPGQGAGHLLSVARSRTNYEPHLVDQEWYHETPTGFAQSTPECGADVDGDGLVGVTDLLALLGAWGAADPFADIAPGGGDLTVDVVDLLALLGAWGPCPEAP